MEQKKTMPPIGLRIIKSAIGVFLCYVVNILRRGSGIVFYSQLAVLWCMQDYISGTKAMAKQRTLGTVIGAIYGLITLIFMKFLNDYGLIMHLISDKWKIVNLVQGGIISIFIVMILYTTVILKKKQASYFSCVVFLSIVVNHMEDVNPYLFVWNRFLDTMIGIGLGVFVNCFTIRHKKNKSILFVSGVDDTLLNENDNMTGFSRVELNRMIEDGALFTLSTMRTPASIMEALGDIRLKLPVIVMDGAALFDFSEGKYKFVYVISQHHSQQIIQFLTQNNIPFFSNVIVDNTLLIYYQETESEIYNHIVKSMSRSPYRNYVKRPVPTTESVVYFMILEKTDIIEDLYRKMMDESKREEQAFPANMKILKYKSSTYPGYSYIKIYNHNAVRENMLHYLLQSIRCEKVVTFGTIPGKYTHVINPGDSNRVVKIMKNEFEPYGGIDKSRIKSIFSRSLS